MSDWQPVDDRDHWIAPEGIALETKIDDKNGVRNVQTLKRRGGLWWYPDDSMYVYYTPTHWRRPSSSRTGETP